MNTPGLILSPGMSDGFRFVIMDVNCTEHDRIIELNAPEELYAIATLLRDTERYVVESVWSRSTAEQAVAVSTSRLHNIAGKYTGRDDPRDARPSAERFSSDRGDSFPICDRPLCCRRDARLAPDAANARRAQFTNQLLRRATCG